MDRTNRTERLRALAWGQVIREERLEKGLGQKHIARAIQRKQPAVSDIELGKSRVRTLHLWPLAEVLGLTVTELFHRVDIRLKELEEQEGGEETPS